VPKPNNQYGGFLLVGDTTEGERGSGTKGGILGNGKKFQRGEGGGSGKASGVPLPEEDTSLPF